MIDTSAIYRNPLIREDGYYFIKVISVDVDHVPNSVHPRIFVRVQLHPDYGLGNEVTLASIIYGSDSCRYHRINFLNTFWISDENHIHLAVGKWGSVQIYRTTYMETEYSAIKWVYQPQKVKLACSRMNQEQQGGKMPELPQADPTPHVSTVSIGTAWQNLHEMELDLLVAKREDKWKKRHPGIPFPRLPKGE